jgi:Arf-GAP/SH3 domain/ANK repeat/PH domain-containing protein
LTFQLLHALQRKKTMFENVNIDWHISQDDGSTDFSDDETLDDPSTTTTTSRLNGTRTPERVTSLSPNKLSRSGLRPLSTVSVLPSTPLATPTLSPQNNNNNNNNGKSDWVLDRTPGSDWSRSTPSDSNSGGSPGSYRIMPPPPPPQSKKPALCKFAKNVNGFTPDHNFIRQISSM